jgi:hypothetical protein
VDRETCDVKWQLTQAWIDLFMDIWPFSPRIVKPFQLARQSIPIRRSLRDENPGGLQYIPAGSRDRYRFNIESTGDFPRDVSAELSIRVVVRSSNVCEVAPCFWNFSILQIKLWSEMKSQTSLRFEELFSPHNSLARIWNESSAREDQYSEV